MQQRLEDGDVLIRADGARAVRIRLEGEVDLTSADVLRSALDGAIEAGTGDVEVELSEITFCDSTGLCLLLTAERTLRAAGRTLRLVDPAPGMLRLLDLSATREVFEIRTSSSPAGVDRPR